MNKILLNEILNPSLYNINFLTKKSMGNKKELFVGNIKIENNEFEIEFRPSLLLSGFYKYSFRLIKSEKIIKPEKEKYNSEEEYDVALSKYEYGVNNLGNPIKILKIIQDILYTFINKNEPRGIMFKDYDEGKRNSVYDFLANKMSKSTGYSKYERFDNFYLFKDNDDMINFKSEFEKN